MTMKTYLAMTAKNPPYQVWAGDHNIVLAVVHSACDGDGCPACDGGYSLLPEGRAILDFVARFQRPSIGAEIAATWR